MSLNIIITATLRITKLLRKQRHKQNCLCVYSDEISTLIRCDIIFVKTINKAYEQLMRVTCLYIVIQAL